MKKGTKFLCFALIAIFMIIIAVFASSPKRKTLQYFHANKDILMQDIAENELPTCSLDITFNYWEGAHPIMEYIVDTRGMVPSSKYYGFFYSYDGEPVAFQNSGIALSQKSETEWEWKGTGDNCGYVELIEGNWFYFEASF